MEYDLNGHRIYGEFTDQFGNKVTVKRAAMDHPMVMGGAQIRIGLPEGAAIYAYPDRENVGVLIAALTAFMADTDGVPDLPEPDAEG